MNLPPIPKATITLDFESYYSKTYSLKKLTTEAYVRDPRFEVIGVGVKLGTRPSVWMEEADFRAWAQRVQWHKVTAMAHHAQFDGLVLSHHYGIRPGFWIDTLSMGRALHRVGVGGSLAALSDHYGIGQKGTEVLDALGKRRRDFSEAEWLKYGGYCNNDVELLFALFRAMREAFPVQELWLIDTTVRMFTEPTFVANEDVLRETIAAEDARKEAKLRELAHLVDGEDIRAVLGSSAKLSALLERLGVQVPRKKNASGALIPSFAKDDPGMQALLESPNEDVRIVCEARVEVKSNIVGSRADRMLGSSQRGALPVYLNYCGAHTHRWSGGDGMNWQNFNRGGALRRAVEAPPGHRLAVVDSGQIEARVVGWVAGDVALMDTFKRNDEATETYDRAFRDYVRKMGREPSAKEAKGIKKILATEGFQPGDFYSDVGSQFFGKPISKADTPLERQISKNMVLGLGFGMGWAKFAGELLKGMLGSDPVQFGPAEVEQYGVNVSAFAARQHGREQTCADRVREMLALGVRLSFEALLTHCAVADHFVRLYRGRNSRIVGTWEAMDRALATIAAGGRARVGKLVVTPEGIVKPGGMIIRYSGLRRTKDGYVFKDGHKWRKAYGGLVTENVVQSLARDVVAEQALWIRADGYHVATTTHDEIVCVVPEDQAEKCLEVMLARMRTPPSWCQDLPLNAEGSIAVSYGDAK